MYHVRITYYDHNLRSECKLYEYDYNDLSEIMVSVTSQYLMGNILLFAGARIENQDVRQVNVYETSQDITTMKNIADANLSRNIGFAYSKSDVLTNSQYSSDITREVMKRTQQYFQNVALKTTVEMKISKTPLLFISHATENEAIAESLVLLLRTLGLNNKNLFCSSVSGYDINEGEDIYDTLASKFREHDIFVILLLSQEYYKSSACLNEMGAMWVLKADYSTIVCPNFSIPEIKGCVNPNKMAVILDDMKRVKGKLNQLKDRLINFFSLPEVEDDTIWENDRDKFLESIEKINVIHDTTE